MNSKLLVVVILVAAVSLVFSPTFVNAEIKLTPPLNWQPSPNNNSTSMAWFQNSTKSVFGIAKGEDPDPEVNFTMPLAFVAPILGQALAESGALESADQLTFGNSNYGFRYFVNLSSIQMQNTSEASKFFKDYGIPNFMNADVPYKGMMLLTQKHGVVYAIFFGSPTEIFDSKLNEIKPTIDSIQLSNSTTLTNRTS